MAKGKKSSGKSYTSKGERRNCYGVKERDPCTRVLNKMDALRKGKDVVFTIENPNRGETNKPFIKVRISGRDFVKNRTRGYQMKEVEA
jgi:hypothetical protein